MSPLVHRRLSDRALPNCQLFYSSVHSDVSQHHPRLVNFAMRLCAVSAAFASVRWLLAAAVVGAALAVYLASSEVTIGGILEPYTSACRAFLANKQRLQQPQPSSALSRRPGSNLQRRRVPSPSHEIGFFAEPLDDRWDTRRSEDDEDSRQIASAYIQDDGDSRGKSKASHELEALSSLHLALEFVSRGKAEKARKLFDHALVLAPRHADVLTEYGYFMETHKKDVVQAETLYAKALVNCPSHEGALRNRERTAPVVEAIDNEMLTLIDEKREFFLKIPRNNPSLRRAMKEAYFLHVYHTVAIEGNTMSLIQTRSILETHIAVSGKSVLEHNEIIGMDAALRYLNQTLVHRIGDITLEDIKEVHRRVLGFVDPVQAGIFRTTQVYVGSFTPVHPNDVAGEMLEFLSWLNSDDSLGLHPVEMAALAHYKLAYIHPFVDGNGRTARLLMNLLLMQAGFPPVIVRVQDRLEYYETLREANDGDLRPFIRFIARCTGRTLDSYLDAVTVHGPRETDNVQKSKKQIVKASIDDAAEQKQECANKNTNS